MFDATALFRELFDELGLEQNVHFALGYSGGCDSQVLLHALVELRARCGFELTALHLDHGLHVESREWADFCSRCCEKFGVPLIRGRRDVPVARGESREAAARRVRYRWFSEVLEPGQVLLTAHHGDDQAESVLLNLMKGGGLQQIAGIPPVRTLSGHRSPRVVRPLLKFTRADLEIYARGHDLQWLEDPSNADPTFDRNYVRHKVLPVLRERWPGAVPSLVAAATENRVAAEWLGEWLDEELDGKHHSARRGVFCLTDPLDRVALARMAPGRSVLLLRHWLHREGLAAPGRARMRELVRQLRDPESSSAELAIDGGVLRAYGDALYLTVALPEASPEPLPWDPGGDSLARYGLVMSTESAEEGGLDLQRLREGKVELGWRAGGERVRLPGRDHSSELKKLWQASGVPPWERRAVPLVLIDGEIAWAHGVGVTASAAAVPGEAGIRPLFQRLAD